MKKLAVSLALVALAVAGTASAEDADKTKDKPVDLKISIWLPPAHALVGAAKGWPTTSTRPRAARSSPPSSPLSNSARRSTTTTWRATASPT